ncbi:Nucleobase-ascorbate transporter 12-like protein, partial [Drosera capensis]
MATSSDSNKQQRQHQRPRWPPAPDAAPMPPSTWAKRTGFRPKFSGETTATDSSGPIIAPPPPTSATAAARPREGGSAVDLEAGRNNGQAQQVNGPQQKEIVKKRSDSDGGGGGGGNGNVVEGAGRRVADVLPRAVVDDDGDGDDAYVGARHSHMKYELRDTPGLVPIWFYGVQHYFSILGSLILMPLVIVPAMGGTNEDTANVVSTAMFMSGVTTLLHSFFGTRLPLVQGPSFVYLAPVLAIINSTEMQRLSEN